jgi:hypothetical protein
MSTVNSNTYGIGSKKERKEIEVPSTLLVVRAYKLGPARAHATGALRRHPTTRDNGDRVFLFDQLMDYHIGQR